MRFNMFSSKRGDQKIPESTLIPLAELLIVLFIIFLPMLAIANGIKDNTTFERKLLALDLATTVTAISNSPGDITVNYDKDTFWYSYKLEESNFKVIDRANIVPIDSNYKVIEDKNLGYSYVELNPEFVDDEISIDNLKKPVKIRIEKKEDKIIMTNID